jgi:hypothetical protein
LARSATLCCASLLSPSISVSPKDSKPHGPHRFSKTGLPYGRRVTLPPSVRRVTIYADYDAPSLSNALAFFARHPELDVWIARPPIIGADFAQILELQSAASKSAALLK